MHIRHLSKTTATSKINEQKGSATPTGSAPLLLALTTTDTTTTATTTTVATTTAGITCPLQEGGRDVKGKG